VPAIRIASIIFKTSMLSSRVIKGNDFPSDIANKSSKFGNLSNIKNANKLGYLSNGQVLSAKK
jgi:hypothetical protein